MCAGRAWHNEWNRSLNMDLNMENSPALSPLSHGQGVCKARHRPICQLHSSLAFSDSLASSFSRVENPFLCVKPTLLGLPHYALARDAFSKTDCISAKLCLSVYRLTTLPALLVMSYWAWHEHMPWHYPQITHSVCNLLAKTIGIEISTLPWSSKETLKGGGKARYRLDHKSPPTRCALSQALKP